MDDETRDELRLLREERTRLGLVLNRVRIHLAQATQLPLSPFPSDVPQHWCALARHWFACWKGADCTHDLKLPCGDCTDALLKKRRARAGAAP